MATQITVDANDLLRIMALCNLTDKSFGDAECEAFARLYEALTRQGTKGAGVELRHLFTEMCQMYG